MSWMTNTVMSAMESSVVESMLHSSAATSTAFSITASIAGPPFIPCRPSSVTDPWSRRAGTAHVHHPHVKAGVSFNSTKDRHNLLNCSPRGNYHFLYLLVTFCNLPF